MIPGLGLFRRTVTLGLCAASFWGGMQFAQAGQPGACRSAGGAWNDSGFCERNAP